MESSPRGLCVPNKMVMGNEECSHVLDVQTKHVLVERIKLEISL